ncbi:MAG: single-stranded DNA-binding protein [Oscillospiraceae bacterium]|nr:single-stranded DNA-binding protein [Oscillospiraceae bacterium]
MSDLNKVLLSGRLTADPELRQTNNGTMVCSFTIACNRHKKSGENAAEFITIVTWKSIAEFVSRYFTKGKAIIVEGSLRQRMYNDKKYPEVRKVVTEIYANSVYFAGDKPHTETVTFLADVPGSDEYNSAVPVMPSEMDLSDFEEFESMSDNDLPF